MASIHKAALERVIQSNPEFALRFFSSISERLWQTDALIESLLHGEVYIRLATLLINLGERFGELGGPALIIGVRLTHQDLANMVTPPREAVSKVMSEFQREGLIETRSRRIAILDHDTLSERASAPSGFSSYGQLHI